MEWFFLALALLLVLLNGFFVATEFAIVKVRPTRLKALVEEGSPGAANALKMVEKLDGYLSATQFGITLSSLGLGYMTERAFATLIEGAVLMVIPEGLLAVTVIHSISISLALAVSTFLHIVVGELAPKSLAIQRAEATTLAVAIPMRIFYVLFYPAIYLFNGMAGRILKLFGVGMASEAHDAHNEDELRVILHSSAEAGVLAKSKAELIERALSMVEKTARQVLVPRNQVRFLDLEEPLEKNIIEAREAGHTWMPVVRGNLDQVEGVVNVKDLFFLLSRGALKSLSQVQRTVLFVPENVTLEQLLTEFRRRKRQLAVVVDEHGGTSDIVTIADVVAEVVGNVAELGRKTDEVKTLPGGRFELHGSAQLDDIEDRLGIEFDIEEGEVTTIAGYLMSKLGRIPETSDVVGIGGWEIRPVELEGPRVMRVVMQPKLKVAAVPLNGGADEGPSAKAG